MASAEYIAAAKKENRQQTTFLSIEDADADAQYYTTEGQWAASDVLTNINTSDIAGSALSQYDLVPTDSGNSVFLSFTPNIDCFIWEIRQNELSINSIVDSSGDVTFKVRSGSTGGSVVATTETKNLQFDTGLGFYRFNTTAGAFIISTPVKLTASTTYYIEFVYTDDSAPARTAFDIKHTSSLRLVPEDAVNSTLTTSELDMGSILTAGPIFSADDLKDAGGTIAYTYTYSDDNITYSSPASVSDGDTLTASRYYKITASFSSTNGGRTQISELSIQEGNFRYYGTHIDVPFQGIKPYIIEGSVSSLKTEIKLTKGIATTGEVSVKLIWTPDTADLVSTGYLKGKDVVLSAGFVGLGTESYEPVITGSIQDVNLDAKNSTITLKIQTIFKQLEKRKVPDVEYNSSGVISSPATDPTYTTANLITVILDIYEKLGIRDRYIGTEYAALESGDYAATAYKVSRTLARTKPIEAWKLLDQLAQTGSLFLVPQGDGIIRPKVYDRSEAASITLDADEFKYGKIDLLYKDFYSRFLAYYNPDSTEFPFADGTKVPSQSENYDNAKFLFNATAETLFLPEKGQKEWFDQWLVGRSTATTALTVPPAALTDLVDRWNGWYADPLYQFEVKGLPPRLASIEAGDVVGINNLPLPAPADDWDSITTFTKGSRVAYSNVVYQAIRETTNEQPDVHTDSWFDVGIAYEDRQTGRYGYTDGLRWFVLSRTFNPNDATLDFKFLQMPPAIVEYFVDSITATVGSVDSGATNMDAIDGDYMVYNEVSGAPGFDARFNFVNIDILPNQVFLYGRYVGNPAHNVVVYMYDYTTTAFVRLTAAAQDLTSGDPDALYTWDIPNTIDAVDGSGNAIFRVYHSSSGVASHDLYIDKLSLRRDI